MNLKRIRIAKAFCLMSENLTTLKFQLSVKFSGTFQLSYVPYNEAPEHFSHCPEQFLLFHLTSRIHDFSHEARSLLCYAA